MIEIINGSKVYSDNGAKGFDDISLKIEDGEFVFLVGASGSGKTSIIRTLLKEEDLTSGKLIIDGEDVTSIKRSEIPYLRRKMGVVFQDFRLRPNKTVFENVAFAMQIVESTYREIRRNVPLALTLVGLQKKSRAFPNQLSGGEQQRTAIARALVNQPPILLCDEPTGNLDPNTSWEIMTLLGDINQKGTTVIMATHAWDIVDAMKKRVIELENGVIVRDVERGGYKSQE